ncbi:MAG: tetratricopeptide repeat protein [Thermoguttaceae bacterium]|nr:tetratricopeptide repeat protein [Thermoguttaceae bacterium]MDW8039120.1 tetratricopeptide repeat protein [Thermoguttaceae bacterium]
MARLVVHSYSQLWIAILGAFLWMEAGGQGMEQVAEALFSSPPPSSNRIEHSPARISQQVDPSRTATAQLGGLSPGLPTLPLNSQSQGGSFSASVPTAPGGLDPAEEQYTFAVTLYNRGDWALAARELQTFLRQYPHHPNASRANFLLAETLLQLGQYEDAHVRFNQYLDREPQGLWAAKAWFRSGEAAFWAGKSEQATSRFKEFLSRYPSDPLTAYALWYLGQLARKEKNWSSAAEYFRQCLERFPQSSIRAECQLGLAQSQEALGEAEQAIRLYQTLAHNESDPVGAEAQFRLAVLLYNLQRYLEAAGAFQGYERRSPRSGQAAYARLYRGFALFHLKKWQEAAECFAELASLGNPDFPGPSHPPMPEGSVQPSPSPRSAAGSGGASSGGTGATIAAGPEGPKVGESGGDRFGVLASVPTFPGLWPNQLQQLRRQAQYWLGMVQRQQAQWADSAKTFTQLAQSVSEPAELVECHYYAADGWLRAQNPKAALMEFDLALQAVEKKLQTPPPSTPGSSFAQPPEGTGQQSASLWLDKILLGRLEAAVLLQDHSLADRTAKEFFQRCAHSPLAAEAACWHSQSLLHRKQFQEAIQVLEPWAQQKALAQELAWQIRYLLAYAYQAVGRLAEAQAQLNPLLEADKGQWKSLAQLAQASILMAQKQYQQASQLLEAYLAAGADLPAQTTAQAQLALCYGWLRQTEKAQRLYQALSAKHTAEAWFRPWCEQLAEAALEAGDFAWAKSLFEQLATNGEPTVIQRALLGLGWTQYRAGQYPEAAETLARLLRMEQLPASVAAEATFLRATILTKLRQPDAALALFGIVVDKYSNSKWFGPALLASARLQAQLGQHNQATQYFQRYVETFPHAADLDTALYDWAWSLKDSGQTEEAMKLFERIHQEFPKSPYWAEATIRLAQQAYQARQYERAGELVRAVLANCQPPDLRPYALYLQLQIAAAQGQWESVGQLAQQLLHEHPGSPLQVYTEFWQAELAFRKKDFPTAGKLLEEFVKKYPSLPSGLAPLVALRQAQLLAHQRRWDEVLQAATRIREQYPQFDQLYEADYLLGRALAMKARFDEAREAFQRVIRSPQGAKTETAAMAQWYIGETYFHQRDYQTALRAYLLVEVLYAYPEWQALALLEAARCHQMLGQADQAQKLYQRLLADFPNTAAAQQYRSRQTSASQTPQTDSQQPTSAPVRQMPIGSPQPPEQKRSQRQPKLLWEPIEIEKKPLHDSKHICLYDFGVRAPDPVYRVACSTRTRHGLGVWQEAA